MNRRSTAAGGFVAATMIAGCNWFIDNGGDVLAPSDDASLTEGGDGRADTSVRPPDGQPDGMEDTGDGTVPEDVTIAESSADADARPGPDSFEASNDAEGGAVQGDGNGDGLGADADSGSDATTDADGGSDATLDADSGTDSTPDADSGAGSSVDADAGDASCGDTAGDMHNCGRCGHDCLGGQCLTGTCQPVLLAPPPVGIGSPSYLALDANHVYWTNKNGWVGRVNLDGTDPRPKMVHFLVDSSLRRIAVRNDILYVTSPDYVWTVNSDGTNLQPFAIAAAPFNDGIVVNDTAVFWANEGPTSTPKSNALLTAALDGGGLTVLADGGAPRYLAIDGDGTHVYWTAFSTNQLFKTTLDGGGSVDLSQLNPAIAVSAIAVDATNVYWLEGAYFNVMRVSVDGLGTPAALAPLGAALGDITLDDSYVYWTDSSTPNGVVNRCPKTGANNPATPLAQGQDSPMGIVVDANAIYWASSGSTAGGVYKLAKP